MLREIAFLISTHSLVYMLQAAIHHFQATSGPCIRVYHWMVEDYSEADKEHSEIVMRGLSCSQKVCCA